MSRFSDSGCFAQIIVIAIFLGIFGIYNACENSEWMMMREARKSSDASSYSRYLKKYPHGRYIKEAEDSVFSICCRKRKFDDYINMFSQGRYIQSTDDTLFVICKQKGLFDEYNELFPNGKHINEVYDCLFQKHCDNLFPTDGHTDTYAIKSAYSTYQKYKNTSLGDRLKPILDKKATEEYNNARKVNSIAKWTEFKNIVPYEFQKDADARIKKLDDLLWANESTAWKRATEINTQESYGKYLDKHPKGIHRKQAIDNQVALIIGSEHGRMPQMDRNYYTGYSYSTIDVYNNTQYHLTLLYSGKESKRIVLAPQRSQTISLTNGTYRVAASVNASNVRSYAGTETLNASSYSVSYYIQTYRY